MDGRGAPTIAKRDARVSSVVSPKRQREGLPVTDVLPPEVRRGRMGDKCWPRDQSITESDEGQKDEDEGGRLEGRGKGRVVCRDLANRVPHCCSRQIFYVEPLRCELFRGSTVSRMSF